MGAGAGDGDVADAAPTPVTSFDLAMNSSRPFRRATADWRSHTTTTNRQQHLNNQYSDNDQMTTTTTATTTDDTRRTTHDDYGARRQHNDNEVN